MTTIELKRTILRDVESLMGDEQAVQRLQRYIRRLKRERSQSMTLIEEDTISKEDILAGIDAGLKDVKAGKTRSAYDLLDEL